MPIRSELHPGATLPDQGRAMSDAEVALGFNHTLVGFLDLPSRQGPCSDLNQVPPGRDKMSKSKSKSWSWSWSAMPELKPHFRYCRFCLWRFFCGLLVFFFKYIFCTVDIGTLHPSRFPARDKIEKKVWKYWVHTSELCFALWSG